jgi:hypothetical protein
VYERLYEATSGPVIFNVGSPYRRFVVEATRYDEDGWQVENVHWFEDEIGGTAATEPRHRVAVVDAELVALVGRMAALEEERGRELAHGLLVGAVEGDEVERWERSSRQAGRFLLATLVVIPLGLFGAVAAIWFAVSGLP